MGYGDRSVSSLNLDRSLCGCSLRREQRDVEECTVVDSHFLALTDFRLEKEDLVLFEEDRIILIYFFRRSNLKRVFSLKSFPIKEIRIDSFSKSIEDRASVLIGKN